ncbi:hypothetical protein GCM10010424_63210 [Streptomyces lienomycini]
MQLSHGVRNPVTLLPRFELFDGCRPGTLMRAFSPRVRIDRWNRLTPPMTRHRASPGSQAVSPETAADVVERLVVTAGLADDWPGHSPRRGSATAARAAALGS